MLSKQNKDLFSVFWDEVTVYFWVSDKEEEYEIFTIKYGAIYKLYSEKIRSWNIRTWVYFR